MKFLLILLLIGRSFCAIADPTNLNPGDVAIIGYNFTDPDEFSFITFVDLDPGTVIYFTDCGWKDDNTFRIGEGVVTYTVPSIGIEANTVITYGTDVGFASHGVSGFFGFSIDGDQILVYQGSFSAPQFIFALNSNQSSWQTNSIDNNTSALPPGLTEGLNAVAVHEVDNASYNCVLNNDNREEMMAKITDATNWSGSNITRVVFPSLCFDISLAVDMISFDVVMNKEYNDLKFVSCNEENVLVYELERSDDAVNFKAIGTITPFNGNECKTYIFRDLYIDNCYYRIKEITNNGEELYHKIVSATRDKMEIIGYCIYDVEGKIKMQEECMMNSDKEIYLKAENLCSGLYFVRIITTNGMLINKYYKH